MMIHLTGYPNFPPPRGCGTGLLPVCALLLLTGCAAGQSGFQQAASSAGAELAAAASTIAYVHTGRLPVTFARSSFVNYRSALHGTEEQLRTADGAPRGQRLDALLGVYRPAWQAVQRPCLEGGCGWDSQVRALRQASQALVREGGG